MKAFPNFEDAVRWVHEGDIKPDARHDPRYRGGDAALDRQALLFKRVFSTREGELVLQTILDASLFRSPVDHRLSGDEYLRHAQLREGENKLAALILAYLDHAEKLETTHDLETQPDDGRAAPNGPGNGGSADRRPAGDAPGGGPAGAGADWNAALR